MPGVFSFKRHFLFDLDGTLVDSAGAHFRAYVEALSCDYPALARSFDYAPFAGQPTGQVFRALGIEEPALTSMIRGKQEIYRLALDAGEVELFSGVVSLLDRLHRQGKQLFLVTGASRISTERILEATNVKKFFEAIITAEDAQAGKPSPEPYLLALAAHGLNAGDCLAVEDGESGVRSAQGAGIDVVLLHTELNLPEVLQIKNCEELAALVLE
jgi:HAD superfamily hydrolase (TIGR01509 family)